MKSYLIHLKRVIFGCLNRIIGCFLIFFFLIEYKSFSCFFTSETSNKGLDPSLESLPNKLLMSVLRKKTNFFFFNILKLSSLRIIPPVATTMFFFSTIEMNAFLSQFLNPFSPSSSNILFISTPVFFYKIISVIKLHI